MRNNPEVRTEHVDVLVVGTGFGAAAPALRLAQAGLKVVMVEQGPEVGPGPGYRERFRQTQEPAYLTRYIKGLAGPHLQLTYAEALGGGSGFYEMVSLRAPSLAFEQRESDGSRLWPAGVDRARLNPWYDQAEAMLGVQQISETDVPRSGLVFSAMMKRLGYSCDRAPYAVRGCLGSGFCVTGCIYGAKQSLHLNYLPQAKAAGAVILCEHEAIRVEPCADPAAEDGAPLTEQRPRYVVTCRSRADGRFVRYYARLVVLGGGTLGTAALLLRSRPYLPGLSQQLGRRIGINASVKVVGLLGPELPDGDLFAGRSHPGMISYEFLQSRGLTISAVKALPIQVVSAARLGANGRRGTTGWWGEEHVELMGRLRHRAMALASFGLTPPGGEITLAADGSPCVALTPTRALADYYTRTKALLESIFHRNGCQVLRTDWLNRRGRPHDGLFFSTAHQTGSARMADRVADGVVNAAGQVFGWPGLYVADGAAIPSSLAVNTSLTILANAERIAAAMVSRYHLQAQASPRKGAS